MVNVRLAMAQEERRKIARRTRQGLEAARAKGRTLGRPSTITPATTRRFVRLRMAGMSVQKIAAELTAKRVPTPGGGESWHHSTVRGVLVREGVE